MVFVASVRGPTNGAGDRVMLLLAAATPGPWGLSRGGSGVWFQCDGGGGEPWARRRGESELTWALQYRDGGKSAEINMTEEEARRIGDCFDKPEFMDMFREYVDDISDPKNMVNPRDPQPTTGPRFHPQAPGPNTRRSLLRLPA